LFVTRFRILVGELDFTSPEGKLDRARATGVASLPGCRPTPMVSVADDRPRGISGSGRLVTVLLINLA